MSDDVEDNAWDRRRAITSFLSVAADALQTAAAILPPGEKSTADLLYEARCKVTATLAAFER